jgi:hypothetical protein
MSTDVAEVRYGHSVAAVADPADRWTRSRPLLIAVPADPACEVSVVIPVRDEAATLEAALTALVEQTDGSGGRMDSGRYEILVLANNCLDDSADIARSLARRNHGLRLHVVETQLPPQQAHVGRARQLLMDEAYWRFIRRRGLLWSSTSRPTRSSAASGAGWRK